jgi:hypothetical protein
MKRVALVGFAIWLVATLALRVAGHFVFGTAGKGPTVLLLLVSLPLMVALALVVLRRFGEPAVRSRAAIVLVAPGMLLDTGSAIWFREVFPNIPSGAAGSFGGWLLFCNVVVLLTAAMPRRPSS